ncbi:hypothetical protein D9M72_525860 [compost metagenome]
MAGIGTLNKGSGPHAGAHRNLGGGGGRRLRRGGGFEVNRPERLAALGQVPGEGDKGNGVRAGGQQHKELAVLAHGFVDGEHYWSFFDSAEPAVDWMKSSVRDSVEASLGTVPGDALSAGPLSPCPL